MALYEHLDELDEQHFFEGCKARVHLAWWVLLALFVVLLILAPLSFSIFSVVIGLVAGGGGLAFTLDEKRAKPDEFERLVQENKKLKKELKEIKSSRPYRFKKAFGHKN